MSLSTPMKLVDDATPMVRASSGGPGSVKRTTVMSEEYSTGVDATFIKGLLAEAADELRSDKKAQMRAVQGSGGRGSDGRRGRSAERRGGGRTPASRATADLAKAHAIISGSGAGGRRHGTRDGSRDPHRAHHRHGGRDGSGGESRHRRKHGADSTGSHRDGADVSRSRPSEESGGGRRRRLPEPTSADRIWKHPTGSLLRPSVLSDDAPRNDFAARVEDEYAASHDAMDMSPAADCATNNVASGAGEVGAAAERTSVGDCWCGSASGVNLGHGLVRPKTSPEQPPLKSGLEAVVKEAVSPGAGRIGASSGPMSGGGDAPDEVPNRAEEPPPESIAWDSIYQAINVAEEDAPTEKEVRPRKATRQVI